MSRMLLAVVVGLVIASTSVRAADPPPLLPAVEPHTRVIVHLSSVPVADIAANLQKVFPAAGLAGPQLIIVADAVSNSLILAGSKDVVEEARRMADELDRPATMVHLEVLIGEAPVDEIQSSAAGQSISAEAIGRVVNKPEQLEILARAKFSTLDQQTVQLHMGRREARITGSTVTPRGTSQTVQYENTGTIFAITPRVEADDRIALKVDVEDSRLGAPDDGPIISGSSEGEPIRASAVETWTLKTTVVVASGESVTLAATVQPPDTSRGRLVMLTARVERFGTAAKSAPRRNPARRN